MMTNPHEPGTAAFAERNREIIAGRGCWPPGALAAVRQLEQQWPGWHAWWTERPWRADGKVPDGPCYGASPLRNSRAGYGLYAPAIAELAGQIHEAEDEHAALHRYRRPLRPGGQP